MVPSATGLCKMPGMDRSSLTIPRLSLPAALLISLSLLLLTAWVLYWMGRLPICKCGYVEFWHVGRDAGTSQHFADWYTYSHIIHGIGYYFVLSLVSRGHLSVAARLVLATLIECGWEIFENTSYIITRFRSGTGYFGDTIINSMGDILAMIVGFLIAARLPAWVTVFLFVATEAALLALFHDSVLLSLLLLAYPVDWLRDWRAGG
jgi:hypothetical protein